MAHAAELHPPHEQPNLDSNGRGILRAAIVNGSSSRRPLCDRCQLCRSPRRTALTPGSRAFRTGVGPSPTISGSRLPVLKAYQALFGMRSFHRWPRGRSSARRRIQGVGLPPTRGVCTGVSMWVSRWVAVTASWRRRVPRSRGTLTCSTKEGALAFFCLGAFGSFQVLTGLRSGRMRRASGVGLGSASGATSLTWTEGSGGASASFANHDAGGVDEPAAAKRGRLTSTTKDLVRFFMKGLLVNLDQRR